MEPGGAGPAYLTFYQGDQLSHLPWYHGTRQGDRSCLGQSHTGTGNTVTSSLGCKDQLLQTRVLLGNISLSSHTDYGQIFQG